MSENIYGKRMMYVGAKPWHGIGTELQNLATSEEAIRAADLDYDIELRPVFVEGRDSKQIRVPKEMATMNVQDEVPLGIVGENYQIVQNKGAFKFFDSIVGEGQAIYHTAGALGKGERIWLLAKLPKDLILFGEDRVEKYLCLTNSHDGKSALRVYFTPVRVVCQNTLNMSLRDASQGIAIRHTGEIKNKVNEARRVLGFALDFYKEFDEVAQSFAEKKMNARQVTEYYDELLDIENDKEASSRTLNVRNQLFDLFERGQGNRIPQVRHSLWAAYNAVAEYTDHYATIKNVKSEPSNRLKNIWFGKGKRMKVEAYEQALVLLKK